MGFMTVYISLCIQGPKNTFKFRSFVICAFPRHISCAGICMYEFAYIGMLLKIMILNSFLLFLSDIPAGDGKMVNLILQCSDTSDDPTLAYVKLANLYSSRQRKEYSEMHIS